MAKVTKAKQRALDEYGKVLKNYRRKLHRLEGGDIDYSQWFDEGLGLKEVRNFSTVEINSLIRNMKDFTTRGGEKILKYNKNFVPKAFKQQYQRALKRYNARKTELERYRLHKLKKPPESFIPFQEHARRTIYKASPKYRYEQRELYKHNYIKAIRDNLQSSEYYQAFASFIEKIPADKLISTYYTLGNEDLGINALYPGDPEESDMTIEYITERWGEELGMSGEWTDLLGIE